MSEIKWHKIAASEKELHFASNNLLSIIAGSKKITIAKTNHGLKACAYACPHASGIMSEGFIDALGNIVCPLHKYRFNLENGRNTSGEGYYLKTYPVEVREDGVYVGFADKKLFGIF